VADCANRPNPELYKLIRNSSTGSTLPNTNFHVCTVHQ